VFCIANWALDQATKDPTQSPASFLALTLFLGGPKNQYVLQHNKELKLSVEVLLPQQLRPCGSKHCYKNPKGRICHLLSIITT